MKPSLSCSSDSPNERVNNVEAVHSDLKDMILSDEAYPEERSHGQSLDERKVRFDIGNLHRVKTHVWQIVRLVIYHTIFITRYRETGRILKNQGCEFVGGASCSIAELT